VFTILRLQNHITFLPLLSFIVLALLGMIIIVLWLLYNFVDWRNDIYQVTAEQIWDIERKPLGKEEKRSAPLENILSIEYERLGLIGLLFNFGTVNIQLEQRS
jgi:flagellar basal body-associated protein FliL